MKRLRAFFDRSLLRRRMIAGWRLLFALLKWILAGGLCGVAGGLLGAAFHHAVHGATDLFARYHWILWLLPVGSVLTVLA